MQASAENSFSLDEDYYGFGIKYHKTEEGRPNLLSIENKNGAVLEYSNFPKFYVEAGLSEDCGLIYDDVIASVEAGHEAKCDWEIMAERLSGYSGRDEIIYQILDEEALAWQIRMMQSVYPIDLVMNVDDKNNLNKWSAITQRSELLAAELPDLDLAATFKIVETYDRKAQWEGFAMGMNPVAAGLRADPEIARPATPRPPAFSASPRTFVLRPSMDATSLAATASASPLAPRPPSSPFKF